MVNGVLVVGETKKQKYIVTQSGTVIKIITPRLKSKAKALWEAKLEKVIVIFDYIDCYRNEKRRQTLNRKKRRRRRSWKTSSLTLSKRRSF